MDWTRLAERTWERSQIPVEGKEHNPHALGNFVWVVVSAVTKVCFRVSAKGLENVRQFKDKSGALIICNHASYSDPVFHYVVIRPGQWPRFMAKESVMSGPKGWLLGLHGAFPVARDSADLSAVKRAVRYLKDGELVAIFPEGTRRNKGDVELRIHAGAALIARMAKAPIIPSTIHNADRIKVKGERVRFPKVTVEYGAPLELADFEWIPKKERMEAFSWYAMRECFALKEECAPQDVDMAALFPLDTDYSELFGSWKPGDPRESA